MTNSSNRRKADNLAHLAALRMGGTKGKVVYDAIDDTYTIVVNPMILVSHQLSSIDLENMDMEELVNKVVADTWSSTGDWK